MPLDNFYREKKMPSPIKVIWRFFFFRYAGNDGILWGTYSGCPKSVWLVSGTLSA